MENLSKRPNKKSNYIMLRSEQLVGTALMLIIKSELTGVIRNVEMATRKTGLRGMAGNKGAVGIRFEYHDTSFCFITAHLAAGHSNVEERNNDYWTIANGLQFLRGKGIASHDNVIWLADTNYRIDLENDVVRRLAQADELDQLVASDQLVRMMDSQAAFLSYEEGPLLFRPTYKYDLHSDVYDSSEKMRIPAWTDRILFRGDQLDLNSYSRAEIRSSDHRPVYALFRASVRIVDIAKRTALSQQLLRNVTSTAPGEKLEEKLAALVFNSNELPPPSSDESAWWDGPGHPNGKFPPPPPRPLRTRPHVYPTNPFDSDESSHSSSDEELYTDALSLTTPIIGLNQKSPRHGHGSGHMQSQAQLMNSSPSQGEQGQGLPAPITPTKKAPPARPPKPASLVKAGGGTGNPGSGTGAGMVYGGSGGGNGSS
jgi:hypothetical protein